MSSRHRPRPAIHKRAYLSLEMLESRDLPSGTAPDLTASPNDYATDHILVRWLDGSTPANTPIASSTSALGNNTYIVNLPSGVSVATAVNYYQHLAGVDFAQPDYEMHVNGAPNDPGFSQQWNLQNTGQSGGTAGADIGVAQAWNYTTGSKNIIVAVIDTGIDYNHPDLAANLWRNPGEIAGNGKDDDGDGIVDDVYGANFSSSAVTGNPADGNGHGTNLAGIIGAVGNNGKGVSGVDPNVQLMALKFMDNSGNGSTAHAVQAVYYAVNHGAKIINASWGGNGSDSAMSAAIQYAHDHGVIFVAAAGNNSSNNDAAPFYPANYASDNVVSVAATDRNDRLATFSDYGKTTVDLAAPGVSIYSTYPTNLDANNPYRSYSGTSQAAPQVAGALALVWSAHPSWTYSQVINAVVSNTDALPSLTGMVASGGRLDVGKALANTMPAASSLTATQVDWSANPSTSLSTVRITFSSAINPATLNASSVSLKNPSGQAIALTKFTAVAGSNNTAFDVTFATQTQAGIYALIVGPNVRDLQNRAMDQNKNGTPGEAADSYASTRTISSPATSMSGSYYSGNLTAPIRSGQTTTATMTIPTHLSITNLTVKLNISATNAAGMIVTLVSPTGKEVNLSNQRGGAGNGFSFTIFDDKAATAVLAGTAPFGGTFRPDGALASLNGTDLYGTWKIVVTATSSKTNGAIQNFTINASGTTITSSSTRAAGTSDDTVPGTVGSSNVPNDIATATSTTNGSKAQVVEAHTTISPISSVNVNPASVAWIFPTASSATIAEQAPKQTTQPPVRHDGESSATKQAGQPSIFETLSHAISEGDSDMNVDVQDLDVMLDELFIWI